MGGDRPGQKEVSPAVAAGQSGRRVIPVTAIRLTMGGHPLQDPGVPLRDEAGPRYVLRDHRQTLSRQRVFGVKGPGTSSETVAEISTRPSSFIG